MLMLALLITFSASAATLSFHACCGSVQGLSLFDDAVKCKLCKEWLTEKCAATKTAAQKICCAEQQVPLSQSAEKLTPAVSKFKDRKANEIFDVLFFYTLFQNWFGSEEKTNNERLSPGLVISKALILLFQQFRI